MKILLSLVICSYVQGVCMPAYEWPEQFNTMYDCLTFGYEESNKKMKEIFNYRLKYPTYIEGLNNILNNTV